jgi:hypothetical protein
MAQEIAPDAHVVYVDNDPVVWSHGNALLANGDRAAMMHADLRQPAEVLQHPDVLGLLDLAQPVAVLCASVLHFVSDQEDPHGIIAEYRSHMAAGSYLAITHGPVVTEEEDPTGIVGSVTSVYYRASAQLHFRSGQEIRRLFDGFDLVDPGVVWITEWRPDPGVPAEGPPRSLRGGVGRKR